MDCQRSYGFNQGQAGTVLITGFNGALLVWIVNFGQNVLLDRRKDPITGFALPKAGLYYSALSGFVWSLWNHVSYTTHYIVSCVALAIVNFGILPIYSVVYAYIGDAYESYFFQLEHLKLCLEMF